MSTDTRVEQRLSQIQWSRRLRVVLYGVLLALVSSLFLVALSTVGFSISELIEYWGPFMEELNRYFPGTDVFGVPFLDFGRYWEFIVERNLFTEALVTLAMGFAGTLLGLPGALLLGVLGSERVTPFPLNFIFRGIMSTIRAIPALVWVLIYIPLGGVSPFTVTIAIGTDTMGNLGRLFTDELEEIKTGPIEAIESTGANKVQTVAFGMLSQVFTPFIAWTMYILEINVRIAVTAGLIGGGGIGYVLLSQKNIFALTNMMATILVILVLVVSVEMISQRTRSYLRGKDEENSSMGLLKRLLTSPQRIADSMSK